ncbi:MAG: hypothetical protein IKE70_01875 [Bacilli bacterium]|nr:hypothetical protein [Bacilli bacterium]
MVTLIALIGIMGLGYAFLHTDLKINGVANIPSASWNVHFKENSINETTGSVAIDTTNNEQAARIDDDIKTFFYTIIESLTCNHKKK